MEKIITSFISRLSKAIKSILGKKNKEVEAPVETGVDPQTETQSTEPEKDVLALLNEIFIELFEDDNLKLTPETTARDIEDWDSLQQVRIIIAVEKKFNIKIPPSKAANLNNVGELVELIKKQ